MSLEQARTRFRAELRDTALAYADAIEKQAPLPDEPPTAHITTKFQTFTREEYAGLESAYQETLAELNAIKQRLSLTQCGLCYGEPEYEMLVPVNETDGGVHDASRWLCHHCAALVLHAIGNRIA